MHGRILKSERIPEPTEINQALAQLYGYNRFGDPLYRLVWGQSETMQVRGLGQALYGHARRPQSTVLATATLVRS